MDAFRAGFVYVEDCYAGTLSETEDGTCLYFLDYGMEKSMSLRLLRICLYVGLLGIVLIFIPVFFLSR